MAECRDAPSVSLGAIDPAMVQSRGSLARLKIAAPACGPARACYLVDYMLLQEAAASVKQSQHSLLTHIAFRRMLLHRISHALLHVCNKAFASRKRKHTLPFMFLHMHNASTRNSLRAC